MMNQPGKKKKQYQKTTKTTKKSIRIENDLLNLPELKIPGKLSKFVNVALRSIQGKTQVSSDPEMREVDFELLKSENAELQGDLIVLFQIFQKNAKKLTITIDEQKLAMGILDKLKKKAKK